MIKWQKQGEAVVGPVVLGDGQPATVVLVGTRQNPKGAAIVLTPEDNGPLKTTPLNDALGRLDPAQVIDIVCVQERIFGNSGLPPAELP
ncbi:MAG TPA: hypothetical protein HPP77_11135 [Candidatus Hydrogenedentes bacterium]|nr:hypothetical protein [Candidatus Hydrogenedentota bacterium]HIJ74494.1 hypothetical protein [Candidatus Hydrogenedentota bacterium]